MVRRRSQRYSYVIGLAEVEVALLTQMLDELDDLATEPSGGGAVTERLYPDGYADEAAARDFRDLTQVSLAQERRDRYGQCRAELPDPAGELQLEADSVQRWLVVLNDMRLALGTGLGVTAEGFTDETDPARQAAYHWLTAVQDDLLSSVLD
jgi:hypothetical protein